MKCVCFLCYYCLNVQRNIVSAGTKAALGLSAAEAGVVATAFKNAAYTPYPVVFHRIIAELRGTAPPPSSSQVSSSQVPATATTTLLDPSSSAETPEAAGTALASVFAKGADYLMRIDPSRWSNAFVPVPTFGRLTTNDGGESKLATVLAVMHTGMLFPVVYDDKARTLKKGEEIRKSFYKTNQ